jgi:hypothetical protein
LLRPGVEWWDLVRCGPPGFDAYVRVAFHEDEDRLRAALATLARHTTTPDEAYAAIWEGWEGSDNPPEAPRVEIPNRTMLLFTGDVEVLRDAPDLAWYGEVTGDVEPHLLWPQDQAWCMACDVDEELEFTVGCSVEAARALTDALPGVRHIRYGEPAPLDS